MKHTVLTMTLAAQLAASAAFAQTSETTDPAMTSTFGSDWSSTLGSAMFNEGGTTVRPSSELMTQWQTLSEEDKTMIQRDCMALMQHSGGTSDTTGAEGATAPTDSAGTAGTDGTTETAPTTDTQAAPSATGVAPDSTTGTTSGTTSADAAPMMNVSMEQMEEICAATKDF